ncbi:HD domain-containing protein [Candidatus Saccharibacteria bacterium]|nr:HD domain-containing protein [Candidatus Saccharibacteria bacterium]
MFEQDVLFEEIMKCERRLQNKTWYYRTMSADKIRDDLQYIKKFIVPGTIARSFNHKRYNKPEIEIVPESIAAHVYAMTALVNKALDFNYGEEFKTTKDGYSRREFLEAVMRHDLPENEIGDIPDDGNRDDKAQGRLERVYWKNLSLYNKDKVFEAKVYKLLKETQTKSSEAGRLIHVADKAIAILRTLYEDKLGIPAEMDIDYEYASALDKKAMVMCDNINNNRCRASEMWTISFFKLKNNILFDRTGYFTALIVMMTLDVNGKWYDWRTKEYLL